VFWHGWAGKGGGSVNRRAFKSIKEMKCNISANESLKYGKWSSKVIIAIRARRRSPYDRNIRALGVEIRSERISAS